MEKSDISMDSVALYFIIYFPSLKKESPMLNIRQFLSLISCAFGKKISLPCNIGYPTLKLHKRENFLGFNFDFCTFL
jgi:hypothetical protein